MVFRLIISLFFLLFFSFSFSQTMTISGHAVDTTNRNEIPLVNATAMLVRIKDSLLIDFKRSDRNGDFDFKNIPYDTLQLVVSHPRFAEQSYYIFGSVSNAVFPIKRIVLPPKSQELKEVIIYAYKDPIYYKGDTLVYVADSFATKPNAVVEDLLKKLPGIQVATDGSIKSQGKEITQVLVDGDEFFGADATIATKNLAAQGVESVQVYEKKNENSTDGDETIQVLDLKMKDSAKKGYFGKSSLASDFNRFYEGEFLANRFNKKQKISVFSLVSNTTRSSLAWQDAYKFGIDTGWGYNEEEDNWQRTSGGEDGTGVPRTIKTGVYFTDQLTEKLEFGINYTYGNSSLLTTERSQSQYFLTDTSYVTQQESEESTNNQSHALNLSFTYKLDSLTTLEFEPKFNYNLSERNQTQATAFLSEDLIENRKTSISNINDQSNTDINSRFSIIRNFKKKDRKLVFNYRFDYKQNQQNGNLYSLDNNFTSSFLNDTIDQLKENTNSSLSNRAMISYVEPITLKLKAELEYEFFTNSNNQDKQATNFVDGSYSEVDLLLTNQFASNRMQHRVGGQLIYEVKKHRLSAGVRVRTISIDNENLLTGVIIPQNVVNVLPRMRYTYKLSQNNRLQVNYTSSSSLPTVNQLQPVPDNTNPNRIVEGNPDLKPNFTNQVNISFNIYKPISGRYLWTNLSFRNTNDAFTSSMQFDQFGRTISKTVNVDGNYSANFYMGGGLPIYKQIIEFNPRINAGVNTYNNFINSEKNTTVNQNIGAGLGFSFESDSLELSIGGDFSYTNPKSTISSASNLPYYSQYYNAYLKVKLPFRLFIESDANYTINSQRAEGYDINFLIWNASLNRTFLKNENLILGIMAYDILNQNISADRMVSANIITDQQTNIIARYFLAKLTYKFNSTKTKESDDFF